ncbi:MAG: hypothetical protein KBC91_06965, partial [Candidatus Omnitrophica bacterium]|nr:hypothetical protein [Candidatus Omnitrophota bacterium]
VRYQAIDAEIDGLGQKLQASGQEAAAMAVDFIVKGQGDLNAVSIQIQLAGEQGGVDAFVSALTNAARVEIAQLRSEVRAGAAVEDFNPEIAEFAIGRINEIFGLDPADLKGSYGLVFNVPGEERAFSDAAKQGLNAFLTTIFSAKGVDVGLLDTGTLVQPVGSLNGLNPLAMENKNALPVVGDTPVNNPRLFLAKSEGKDTMENDPYKRVVDLYVRAIMGANVSVLVEDATRLKDASVRKQVSDTLLSKITAAKITEAVANGLFKLDSEGQLVVNRDNLFTQIIAEFQAKSEVRKAA